MFDFEIIDFERNMEQNDMASWSVTGRLTDRKGQTTEFKGAGGLPFPIDGHEEHAEGALLSACAEVFVQCVHGLLPFFPWNRIGDFDNSTSGN